MPEPPPDERDELIARLRAELAQEHASADSLACSLRVSDRVWASVAGVMNGW
jgi:hypothetical protein